jgi:hypothetical protein
MEIVNMKNNTKKITTILMIVLLVGTIGASTASAAGFFNFRKGTGYNDLVDKWEEIQIEKQELRDMLEGYGIDLPDLTNEQKREVSRTVRELRRDGTNREEIRDAVVDLLIDFGVDLPDLTSEQRAEIRTNIKTMLEDNYGFVFIDLTAEQKAYIKQTIIQLKRQGTTKEEIKAAVIDLYESYGGIIPELTDEQKEEVHDWIVNMLETDYGLDLPNLTLEQRESIENKKSEIKELQKELRQMFKDAGFITKLRFFRYIRRAN